MLCSWALATYMCHHHYRAASITANNIYTNRPAKGAILIQNTPFKFKQIQTINRTIILMRQLHSTIEILNMSLIKNILKIGIDRVAFKVK